MTYSLLWGNDYPHTPVIFFLIITKGKNNVYFLFKLFYGHTLGEAREVLLVLVLHCWLCPIPRLHIKTDNRTAKSDFSLSVMPTCSFPKYFGSPLRECVIYHYSACCPINELPVSLHEFFSLWL